ncbi:hypothetical protein L207DRAFT_493212 [Hyaloscypha variabilis F]|uniref:Uncharacterized protein n=1 Tax=Hyaloscypha variabilis (strain UAMH 11265 / GT02V1 / F) TaxID=1149755 RepID=A0A2J6RGN3_HYAVF|nr:hypothetical protein L207DRAFT_493212 [Hyaloscypha variabilis F]
MSNPWYPGAFARLPWAAFAALLGAIVGIGGSTAVLILSDGVPITEWTFQPTVYLSIVSTITTIMIHYALAQGVTTAWWTRALKTNTKISDLHQYWKTGNSLLAALTFGRNFNLVALASMIVAVSPITGPLLQRASRVATIALRTNVVLSAALAPQLPPGYSGTLAELGDVPSFFSQAFSKVVNDFYDRADITMNNTGCDGTCMTKVVGAGFAVNCSSYEVEVNVTPVGSNYSAPQFIYGIDVFGSNFSWPGAPSGVADPGTLSLNIQYKPDAGCAGQLLVRNCTLSPATVQYSAIINGNQKTISLPANSTFNDDVIQGYYNITDDGDFDHNTTVGGLALALSSRFNSRAHVQFYAGAGAIDVVASGVIANQFLNLNVLGSGGVCNYAFNDPTDTLLTSSRELIFRAAVNAANSSNLQSFPATQVLEVPVYQSHYLYLALGSGFTFLAIIFVLPTFFGYWHLGRRVSMSPIEIAKAFNAPLLRELDSNAEASELCESLGEMGVRYGIVSTGSMNDKSEGVKERVYNAEMELSSLKLEIARSEYVAQPEKGMTFK